MLCTLNSLQYSVNMNFMKTLKSEAFLDSIVILTFFWGLETKLAVFSESACALGLWVNQTEITCEAGIWNVSCAHVQYRWTLCRLDVFMLFSVYGVSQKSELLGTPLSWDMPWSYWTGALCPLTEPEPMPPKTILIIIIIQNQIILTVIWQTVGKE